MHQSTSPILTAALFIGFVTAVIFVVTLECCIDTLQAIGTTKLIQATGDARTCLLVATIATIQVAIATFLLWHTRTGKATTI